MAERANTPNWKKIKAEYIRGGISQQKLADKYGVHRSTLQARMQREGWQQLRSDVVAKTGQKLVKKTADAEVDYLVRMSAKQEKAAQMLYEKLMNSIKAFPDDGGTRTTWETVGIRTIETDDGEEKNVPLKSTSTADLEAIARAMATIGKLLGIDATSVLDKRRLDPYGGEAPEDDGFMKALASDCAEAWQLEDEPADAGDRPEEEGDAQ